MGDHHKLAAELAGLRHGRGNVRRRRELWRLLGAIDQGLRQQRNGEALRLGNLQHALQTLDTRRDPTSLQAAIAASTERLRDLDQRIAEAIARAKE